MEKSAGITLEFKDLDTSKRTAIIKHAVYTSIDRVKDISTKGMFTKSWQENKPDFLLNHVTGATVGSVLNTYDDDNGAYTEVKFGNWTLGNDVLEMAAEGVLKGASFGYISDKNKTDYIQIKGQKVRRLREVKHIETSLLTVPPAHPEAGVVLLNKAEDLDYEDASALLQWNDECIQEMKAYIKQIDAYCRKAKASDDTILALQKHLTEYKQIITDYDTALTQLATEPDASDEDMKAITNFLTTLNIETWKKQSLSNSQK
jgi:HK97 family phage prohead protease